MKKIFNLILLAGVGLFYACSEASEPTATQMLPGNWYVSDRFADFQGEDSETYSRFILETDGSFVLVLADEDELVRGTWSATDASLTLNSETRGTITFDFVYQSYSKMQLDQSITLPTGDVIVTYLLDRDGNNTYYGETYD